MEFLIGRAGQISDAGAHIVQETGTGIALDPQLHLALVGKARGGIGLEVKVCGGHVGILRVRRKAASLVRGQKIYSGLGAGTQARSEGLSVIVKHSFLQADAPVTAPVGVVDGIDVHTEIPRSDGVPDHVQLRMHGVAGAGLQIQGMLTGKAGCRPQLHQVRIELVGALVRGALDAVVKVQVELKNRVREGPQLLRLLYAGGFPGVDIGNFHHRVQVLGGGRCAHQQGR